jgi:hypothetical protein
MRVANKRLYNGADAKIPLCRKNNPDCFFPSDHPDLWPAAPRGPGFIGMTGRSHGSRSSWDRPSSSLLSHLSALFSARSFSGPPACSRQIRLSGNPWLAPALRAGTIRLVDVQGHLAKSEMANPDGCAALPGLPRLQPALGCTHPHQPGMDSLPFLHSFVWLYGQSIPRTQKIRALHRARAASSWCSASSRPNISPPRNLTHFVPMGARCRGDGWLMAAYHVAY